jgi:hypothetical protein
MDASTQPGEEQLRQMNKELRTLVAGRGQRGAEELLPDVDAVLTRYGVPAPSTEGLIQWIDEIITEVEAGAVG